MFCTPLVFREREMPNMKSIFILLVHLKLILLYHASPYSSFALGIPRPTKVLYNNTCFMSGRGRGEERLTPMKRQVCNMRGPQELSIKTMESDEFVRSTSSYQFRRVLLSRCSMVSSEEGVTSMPSDVSNLAAFEIGLQKW